jgi:adenylylsulfate kinase
MEMTKRILIMGLPGAGKTTLAAALNANLFPYSAWLNADTIREEHNDWDFSVDGRIRQAARMRRLADESPYTHVIIDMVAPLPEMRSIIEPDYIIWVDTIKEGRYTDTNKLFVQPAYYDVRVTEQDAMNWACTIAKKILNETKIH